MRHPSGRFAVVMAAFAVVVFCADSSSTVQPGAVDTLSPIAELAARATAAMLQTLGHDVTREGTALYDRGGFGLQIDVGCMGFPMLALLAVAMSAFSAPFPCKLAGIVGGLVILIGLNLLRFVHLFHLGVHDPAAFALMHDVAWRAISVAALLTVWLGWRWWAVSKREVVDRNTHRPNGLNLGGSTHAAPATSGDAGRQCALRQKGTCMNQRDCPRHWSRATRMGTISAIVALSVVVGACHHKNKPDEPGGGGGPCPVPVINRDRALVVHAPALLKDKFSLQKTLDSIIQTSGNPGTTTAADLLQSMINTFKKTSMANGPLVLPVDERDEKDLLPAELLGSSTDDKAMFPVGLFNRFDLAPKDGSNCGEYRIVYARGTTNPGFPRFLMIFEARLPNPKPSMGLAACHPVAKFWADLSTQPDTTVVTELEKFYYQGLPTDSSFGKVVDHANYGVPLGQMRVNMFMEFEWMLREFRTSVDPATAAPIFVADTDKDSPLAEWFRDPSTLPGGVNATNQQAFRSHFLNVPVCNLTSPDRANASATDFDVVNGIGAGYDDAFNEFQSVSQGNADDPATGVDPALTTALTTRLAALAVSGVSAAQLLNRSGAMSCGGCHQFSDGADLGGGHTWPSKTTSFVHIDETGNLSEVLTGPLPSTNPPVGGLLPRRDQILTRFYCNPTPEPTGPLCPSAGITALSAAMPPAPNISAAEVDPAVAQRLRAGRSAAILQSVDEARLMVLAAAGRRPKRGAGATAAAIKKGEQDLRAAVALLDARVRRARAEERALPGAFVTVRRVH